jgi:hypothetical protein
MMKNAGFVDFEMDVVPGELEVELLTEEVMQIRCFIVKGVKR